MSSLHVGVSAVHTDIVIPQACCGGGLAVLVLGCVGGVSCAHLPADAPGLCCAFGLCWAVVVVVVALLVGAQQQTHQWTPQWSEAGIRTHHHWGRCQ